MLIFVTTKQPRIVLVFLRSVDTRYWIIKTTEFLQFYYEHEMFPVEIWEEILQHSDPIDLVRFRRVCQSWCAIIPKLLEVTICWKIRSLNFVNYSINWLIDRQLFFRFQRKHWKSFFFFLLYSFYELTGRKFMIIASLLFFYRLNYAGRHFRRFFQQKNFYKNEKLIYISMT